jgi:hypothetical protein
MFLIMLSCAVVVWVRHIDDAFREYFASVLWLLDPLSPVQFKSTLKSLKPFVDVGWIVGAS